MNEIKIRCLFSKMVPIDDVNPHPNNENKHSSEQVRVLAKIMKKDGITHPITVSNQSGYIAMGCGRLLAFKELEMKEVPVQFMDFEDALHEFRIRNSDNNIARYSEFDRNMFELNLETHEIDISTIDIEEFGKIEIPVAGLNLDSIPNDDDDSDDDDQGSDKDNKTKNTCPQCGFSW